MKEMRSPYKDDSDLMHQTFGRNAMRDDERPSVGLSLEQLEDQISQIETTKYPQGVTHANDNMKMVARIIDPTIQVNSARLPVVRQS